MTSVVTRASLFLKVTLWTTEMLFSYLYDDLWPRCSSFLGCQNKEAMESEDHLGLLPLCLMGKSKLFSQEKAEGAGGLFFSMV